MPLPDFPASNAIVDAVQHLPESVIKGIEDYAITHGCTVDQIIEMTLASFLDVDATSFEEIGDYPTAGQVKEESDTPSKAGGLMSVTAPRADVVA